jgi:Mg2+-importing ATPase
MNEVVPGDVVLLSAGSLVPADGVILEAADFFVSEAVLTGESFPVEKRPGPVAPTAGLRDRLNCVFLGTNARSGTARCLIVATGLRTQFGLIAHRLTLRPPETEFDRGLRRFGQLLTSAMLVMVFLVFIVHVVNGRPPIETLLFSVALAVGLSPELLPAILSVNLARGAQMMARHGVLVRHLTAIENLGSVDVLCTDKTGTLTEGLVVLEGAYDASGSPSPDVQRQGAWNAALETGLASALDDAILSAAAPDLSSVRKLAEIPFDFVRKRVSVVVDAEGRTSLITKGAFHHVLDICARSANGAVLDAAGKARLEARYEAWGAKGIRVLAVASQRWSRSLRTAESWSGISPSRVSSRSSIDRRRTRPTPFAIWRRWACPSKSSPGTASPSHNTSRPSWVCGPIACSRARTCNDCRTKRCGESPNRRTSLWRWIRIRRSGSSWR